MPKFMELKPEEDDIDKFVERSEIFLRVNAVKKEDKAMTLLTNIDKSLYQVVKIRLIPHLPVSKTYDELSGVLKRRYEPKRLALSSPGEIKRSTRAHRTSLSPSRS